MYRREGTRRMEERAARSEAKAEKNRWRSHRTRADVIDHGQMRAPVSALSAEYSTLAGTLFSSPRPCRALSFASAPPQRRAVRELCSVAYDKARAQDVFLQQKQPHRRSRHRRTGQHFRRSGMSEKDWVRLAFVLFIF